MPIFLVQEVSYIDHYVVAKDENEAYNYIRNRSEEEVLQPQELFGTKDTEEYEGIDWEYADATT